MNTIVTESSVVYKPVNAQRRDPKNTGDVTYAPGHTFTADRMGWFEGIRVLPSCEAARQYVEGHPDHYVMTALVDADDIRGNSKGFLTARRVRILDDATQAVTCNC